MRNRSERRYNAVTRLRLAVDCLPVATREAMLDGVRASERIIAGAYVDADGGVCPMLAAHRRGARTDFLSFAKAWDRFARTARGPRAASRRQVAILIDLLEESLASATGLELERAISEHRSLRASRLRRAPFRGTHDVVDPGGAITARRLGRRPRRSSRAPLSPGGAMPRSRARLVRATV